MSEITLRNDGNLAATYVSNRFIDHYMTSANGEYVKIYLYLLRCMGSDHCSFSISLAADIFENTEKDIQRALLYWEKMKLLRLEYDNAQKISGIQLLPAESSAGQAAEPSSSGPPAGQADLAAPAAQADLAASAGQADLAAQADPAASAGQAGLAASSALARPSYTADQLAEFQKEDDVKELLFVTERYLKRTLTPTDINTILFWHEELHFPIALIEYLIEHCVGKGHTSLSYMNRVAINWQASGIATVERAKQAASAFSRIHFAVMRSLGIQGRNLIPSETSMIDRWHKSYGFTQEIIEEACRRTIAATHQPSFDYTEGILKNWSQQQVRSLTDIARLDQAHHKAKPAASNSRRTAAANKFNNFSQRSYDYDKLEQVLLSRNNA